MVQWCRKVMNDATARLVAEIGPAHMDALEISGSAWAASGWKSYQMLDYSKFDICRDIIYDQVFDIVIAEQVIEHTLYPYRAVRNIYRMLRGGGYFLITLPFLIKIHNEPVDCTRWSPVGLTYFLEECGFERATATADGWGNRACIDTNFVDWVEYDPIVHSLDNEPDFPIVVWALAQK